VAFSRVVVFSSALVLAAAIGALPVQVAGAQFPPTTFVGIPSDNATVSGTSQLLDAGTSSGATKVQYEITGGTLTNQIIATGVPTYYGWLAQWNTTTVANGSYTLQSVASFSGAGSATSAPVTIIVNNAPPATVVIIPSNGTMLDTSAGVLYDAVASPGATNVMVSATVLGDTMTFTATPTIYGWIAQEPAFTDADCAFQCVQVTLALSVQSTASYASGLSGTSPVVNTTALLWVPGL
jgi:hypothetical protein